MNRKYLHKTLVLQHDQSDCGAACLLSLIHFYKGENSLEKLRELSGTNTQGATLLGLCQAANEVGFEAEGYEADVSALIEHQKPVILHVETDKSRYHYVICYGIASKMPRDKNAEVFWIGDPGKGVYKLSAKELEEIWVSKACLTLNPTPVFEKKVDIRNQKKEWIKQLVKDDINLLSVSAVLGILIAVLGLVMAVFSQKMIDEILPSKNTVGLFTGIGLVTILLLARSGIMALRQWLLLKQGRDFNNRIVDRFYGSLLYLPKSFFDTRKTGDLTARLNDTRRIQQVVSQVSGEVIIEALVSLVSLIFLFVYSWQIGVLALVSLPVFYLLVYRYNARIVMAQKEVMVNYAGSESNYINTLQGIVPIKNLNKQQLFEAINRNTYGHFQDKIFTLGNIHIRLGIVASVTGVLFLIALLTYGSQMVLDETMQLGELIATLGIGSTLLPSVAKLALVSIPLNEAKVAFNRMFEFVQIKPEASSGKDLQEPLESLTVKALAFRFPGQKRVLNDIDMEVRRGELIAIVGESGCGKSTLGQILQKFYRPEAGDVIINNIHSLFSISTPSWRQRLGVVPQDIYIFNGTILDNICLSQSEKEIKQAISFCGENGFEKYFLSFPQGYATIIGEDGVNLSGGQKQLIALARVLWRKPQLLILDESTSSMDRLTEGFVMQLLGKLKKDVATIFITHRLHSFKSICDCVYIIDGGKTVAAGKHESLMEGDNLYSIYWRDQYNG